MNTNILELASMSVQPKSKNFSLITLGPFEKGFGHTLGHALKRILMKQLAGCAVVEAKVEGALHEYATLEGVEEDVLTILLNLRESAFALVGSRNEVDLELKANQAGLVSLRNIQLPHDVEVANPDHVIATLAQDCNFCITFKVKRGKGECRANHHEAQTVSEEETASKDVNTLCLDAIFNPVKRVSYSVENVRVGEKTDLDSLVIELETDGTRTPDSAIREAASILLNSGLKVILDSKEESENEKTVTEENEVDSILLHSIDELNLKSARSAKCLKTEGIYYIGDLVTKTAAELLLTPNLGKSSLKEIEAALKEKSLSLGTSLPDWPPSDLSYLSEQEAEEIGNQ